jgi:FkbM family methyltransferase
MSKNMMKKLVSKIRKKINGYYYSRKINKGEKVFCINSRFGFKTMLDISKDVDYRFLLQEFENENFELIHKIVKDGWQIIDVGANIGLYSLLFSGKVGKKGSVYAFEPSDEAYYRVLQNIKLNNCSNVELFKMGVADKTGVLDLQITDDDAYNSLGSQSMKKIIETKKINVTSINDFIQRKGIHHIDLIKTDTEGADYLVLKGASDLLTMENGPIIFCEYNTFTKDGFDFTLNSLIDYLKSCNYYIYEFENDRLKEFDPIKNQSGDLVCFKDYHKSMFEHYC